MQCPANYKQYQWKALKQENMQKALYKREVQQWLRSKSYLVHSLFGMIIALLISGGVLIRGVDHLLNMFGCGQYLPTIIRCVPWVLCILIGSSCTTYCSMSIEGKRHWIMETLPMPEDTYSRGKCRLNLLITLPVTIICSSMLALAFCVDWIQGIYFYAVPIIYAVISAYWGMHIEIKHADYTNESEQQVMNQSTSFFLGYLPQLVVPIIVIICFVV